MKQLKRICFLLMKKHSYNKSKFGFAEGWINYNNKVRLFSWQALDPFFFYEPYLYGTSLEDRIKIKQEIFDNLGDTKNKLTLNDGFVLFDYNKIKEVEFKKINGQKGVYFKIEK